MTPPGSSGASDPKAGGPPDDDDSGQFNFVKEALKWQYNIIGLGAAGAFALISGSALPLVLAAGLELIYVSLVPQSSRFRRLVRSWKYAEEKKAAEAGLKVQLQELPPEYRVRYGNLQQVCQGIRANYGRLSSTSQMFVRQTDTSLQGLLQAYLRLLGAARQHADYLRTMDVRGVESDLAGLQQGLEHEAPKVQEINRKRIEILTKRLEKFQKIRENFDVITAQCAALEDVLELIRDQSVTITDPQQISGQLENLMHDVEETEETVRQVEAIFELAAPEMSEIPTGLSDDLATIRSVTGAGPAPSARPREKN